MAGLAILKQTFNLSDEALWERWIENPYFQDRKRPAGTVQLS